MRWPRSVSDGLRGLALGTALLLLPTPLAQAAERPECVALLHGLLRSDSSMKKLQKELGAAGFEVHNIDYGSTDNSIPELAEAAIGEARAACGQAPRLHFVTHSMGGILIRQYLEQGEIEGLGRVVMLGPPNQGSEIIDYYRDYPGFSWFTGPAGMQLGTGEASIPRRLGPVTFDLGVIAGNQSMNPILSNRLPGADDGKVSVESTRVEGMNDHLEMPVTHTFMMRDDEVIEQVVYYLRNGRFLR